MEVRQESNNSGHVKPVLESAVKKFFDQFVQQSNDAIELSIELTNITGTNLQHLNEDCLLEIFSVKSLTLMDLCSLSETCSRFQQIIRRVFPKDFGISYSWYNGYGFKSKSYSKSSSREQSVVERILKNFGSTLTKIVIELFEGSCQRQLDFELNLVAKYCVDSLDSLKIWADQEEVDDEISEDVTVKLKPIFKRLQILDLSCVDIVDDKTLFADFDSLVELSVDDVKNGAALLENIFPKLERFISQGYSYQDDVMNRISTFISRHPKLKTLHLIGNGACCFLQIIGNSCKELEELTIQMECRNRCSLQPLQALKSLKMLKLKYTKSEYFKFLADLPQLRELHLYECNKPDDFGPFALLTQIAKLRIERMYRLGASDVVEIIRRLTNLEELSVDESLDEQTFSRIVDVVKGRPHVLTLKCYFDFNWKNCDEASQGLTVLNARNY